MSAYRRFLTALLGTVMVAGSAMACSKDEGPQPMLDTFLAGWAGGTFTDVAFMKPTNEKLEPVKVAEEFKALRGDLAQTPPTLAKAKAPVVSKDVATAEIAVSQPLPGGRKWDYTTSVRMAKAKEGWRIIWEPAVVHPELKTGTKLATRRTSAERAGVLDAKGEPIVKLRPVVVVGVQPRNITDITKLVAALTPLLSAASGVPFDLSKLPAQVKAASPTAFVEIVSLRKEAFAPIEERLRALDGTVSREEQRMLSPTRTFARPLLGTVGMVTKEIMDAKPGVFAIGDQVGLGGLQRQYDDRLRGVPGSKVVITRTSADGTVHDQDLFTIEPKVGEALKTTLDPRIQTAAEQALATVKLTSAMVAIRISDGAIVAAANSGDNNLAFNAQVPPGSTFKTVSAFALLDSGKVTANQVVACPKFFTVEGRQFKNSHFMELGNVPFHTDFAKSCNTAFVSLAPQIGADGLAAAGAALGLGQPWDLGTEAFSGKVSKGASATELAAAAFGQGQTIVSPVAMAAVAAAVARGQWKQPVVLLDPAAAKPAADGPALKASSVDPLRAMMREVVTAGTATLLADVPGGAVYGKTGTAEYDDNPAHTHAWFIGWQGDLAFAVFVQDGIAPSQSAVPITETFLRTLR